MIQTKITPVSLPSPLLCRQVQERTGRLGGDLQDVHLEQRQAGGLEHRRGGGGQPRTSDTAETHLRRDEHQSGSEAEGG